MVAGEGRILRRRKKKVRGLDDERTGPPPCEKDQKLIEDQRGGCSESSEDRDPLVPFTQATASGKKPGDAQNSRKKERAEPAEIDECRVCEGPPPREVVHGRERDAVEPA